MADPETALSKQFPTFVPKDSPEFNAIVLDAYRRGARSQFNVDGVNLSWDPENMKATTNSSMPEDEGVFDEKQFPEAVPGIPGMKFLRRSELVVKWSVGEEEPLQ
jgi:hypothetical protein